MMMSPEQIEKEYKERWNRKMLNEINEKRLKEQEEVGKKI